MTLSRFLTQYIYIPLGGNRLGYARTYTNILIVFFISGFWHGAGWTFVIWGLLHGFASVVNRSWQSLHIQMPKWLAWVITFLFVHITWVFFRAKTWNDAIHVLKSMFGWNQIQWVDLSEFGKMCVFFPIAIILVLVTRNSSEKMQTFRPTLRNAWFVGILLALGIVSINQVSEFLYFNF